MRLAFYLLPIALALPGSVGAETSRWTVDDLLLAESTTGWALARDGSAAAWVKRRVARAEGEEKRLTELWLYRQGEEPRRLTLGGERVSSPAFSPDGKHLAFLADRPRPAHEKKLEKGAERQVWALPLTGGEARPVTSLDRPVRGFAWAGSEAVVVLAQESPSHWEKEKRKGKDTTRIVDDYEREPPVRLFRVELEGGESRRLTTNRDWYFGLEVSPDSGRALAGRNVSLSYDFDQKEPPHYDLVDLASGEVKTVFAGEHIPVSVRWAPAGDAFYFQQEVTTHPTYTIASVLKLYRHDMAAGTTAEIDFDWPRGLAGGNLWPTAEGVAVLLADGVRRLPARLERKGGVWHRQVLEGTHARNLDSWLLSPEGGLLVYRTSSATTPPQWYRARIEGGRIAGEARLTSLNPGYEGKPTGRVEMIRWQGALGETVEGLLHYPLDWAGDSDTPRPLMVDIHGGPAGVDRDTWDQRYSGPNILYRQRGAFVLQANYHGSSSYGLEWVESIRERYYELEVPDIEAGVDHLIAEGLVDPERLGIYGWSNGGILTADILTRTDRYRAASVGAADVEWISDWANVDFGASFDNYYFGGPPWEIPQVYIDKSPFFRLTEVETPTLIHTGTEDRNVPPHQSWSLFRALQQIGRAETRLALYPGEPHGLRKIAHQRRKVDEDLAWFDRFLFGEERRGPEAVAEGSPLDLLLARQRAARGSAGYGLEEEGLLVPETVPFPGLDGLEVGRFELTRAQVQSLEPSFRYKGSGDLPASGLSFEKARDLVAKLAAATGRPYRLPTVEEAETLAAAGKGGNTLEHWAGYAPNPEDREALEQALAALEGPAPLLLPVGSFPGAGEAEARVYGLGGNAAEWASGEGEEGVAVGPSAERVRGEGSGEPEPAYIGLRVVLEEGEAAEE